MPKKPTKANIEIAAELTIKHEGSVEAAITHYEQAIGFAERRGDDLSADTLRRCIQYCRNRGASDVTLDRKK